jgi:glycine/D-amino acid oxidase-like deaminating enzyme
MVMATPLDDPSPVSPFYQSYAPPPPPTAPLRGDTRCDVAVIGGGFTGISTALHLATAGVGAVVVEAKEIGAGASIRNFGQVVPYLKHDQDDVLRHFGGAVGERLIAATGNAPDYVFGLIAKHGIACSAMRKGLLFAAHAPSGEAALERRTRFWQQRGAPVEMHGRQETAALIGTDAYAACSIDRRGGTINPLAYVRGLAAAASAAGAAIHTESKVIEIRRAGPAWQVATPGGTVTADSVVIATNAYIGKLWPGLDGSIIPLRAHQMVSEPLGDNLRRTILPQGQPMIDTRRLFSGIRLHPDGRLQASADGPALSIGGAPNIAKLGRRLAQMFPQLGPFDWEYRWSGWIAMTYDQYPHLHQLAPGLWAGLGYSGRGIALATMMGRDLARRIAGTETDELVFPVTPLAPRWTTRIAKPLVGSLMDWYRLRDALDDRRNFRKSR